MHVGIAEKKTDSPETQIPQNQKDNIHSYFGKEAAKMSAVAQFDRLVDLAESLGYRVRYENLGGTGGGVCEFGSHRILFIDLSLSLLDQIDQMRAALGRDASLPVDLPPTIRLDLGLPTLPGPTINK